MVGQPIREISALLAGMRPELQPGEWAYATVSADTDVSGLRPLATFQEREAMTVVAKFEDLVAAGIDPMFACAWITLTVHSDLAAVGLTAAVATALADKGMSCNVIAGAYHDHIFVPTHRATDALKALTDLQAKHSRRLT